MPRENEIPKSSLTSAITTDLPNQEDAEARAEENEEHYEADPLVASGVGLVKVDGIDKRYVGLPPGRDEFNPAEEGGLKLTSENTTFVGISQVPFHPSIEIKDPTTGTFYYPKDGVTGWAQCELDGNKLIPDIEPPPEGGGGNGGAGAVSEERSFAGNDTDTLAIDVVTGAVESVEIEGGTYPVPPYTLSPTSDALVTGDASLWASGSNVLVTAVYADADGLDDAARAGSKSKSKRDADSKKEADKKKKR